MGVFVVSGVVFNCDSAITEAFSKAFISTHSNNSLLTYTVVLREQPPPAAFNDVVFAPINNYCSSALFGEGYLLNYESDAVIRIDLEQHVVEVYLVSRNSLFVLPFLFQTDIVAIILSSAKIPIMHASSVSDPSQSGIFAFLGPSKTGKSTMAAYFIKQGFSYFSDDILPIHVCDGVGVGYRSVLPLKLRKDSADYFGDAFFAQPSTVVSSCQPVLGLFFLHPTDKETPVEIAKITQGKVAFLLGNLHHHSLKAQGLNGESVCNLAKCAENINMYSIKYSKQYSKLSDVYQSIISL